MSGQLDYNRQHTSAEEAEAEAYLSTKCKGVIDVLEHFKCPICEDLPQDVIYQCLNGHSICSQCLEKLTRRECPNCRESYSRGKIRNFLAENILSNMQFECIWKEQGCDEGGFDRQNLTKHSERCLFNPQPIKLCQLLFYNDCMYEVSREFLRSCSVKVPPEFRQHLKSVHDVLIYEMSCGIQHAESYAKEQLIPERYQPFTTRTGDIFRLKDDQYPQNVIGLFMIVCIKMNNLSEITWCAIRLSESPLSREASVTFTLKTSSSSKVPAARNPPNVNVSWNGSILSIFEFEELQKFIDGYANGLKNRKINSSLPLFHLRRHYLNEMERLKVEYVFTIPEDNLDTDDDSGSN